MLQRVDLRDWFSKIQRSGDLKDALITSSISWRQSTRLELSIGSGQYHCFVYRDSPATEPVLHIDKCLAEHPYGVDKIAQLIAKAQVLQIGDSLFFRVAAITYIDEF